MVSRRDCYWLPGFILRRLRCFVSSRGAIQCDFCVFLASLVGALATVFRSGLMALGGRFVFFRSGGVRINSMAVFVHLVSSPYLNRPRVPGLHRKRARPWPFVVRCGCCQGSSNSAGRWWLLTSNGHAAREGQLGLGDLGIKGR